MCAARRSASRAERSRAAGNADAAAQSLTEALNQWRGEALADLREFEFADVRAVALGNQRLTSLETWADAELACGRADALLRPLQDLVTEHPTRERLWEQLMIALYRTGRQDAALSAFQAARAALSRELGVDPSSRLVSLQTAILNHDPKLAPMPALRSMPARKMTQTILARSELVITPPTLVGPSGLRVELGSDTVVIGRHEDCDLVLHDDQASRRHAQVYLPARFRRCEARRHQPGLAHLSFRRAVRSDRRHRRSGCADRTGHQRRCADGGTACNSGRGRLCVPVRPATSSVDAPCRRPPACCAPQYSVRPGCSAPCGAPARANKGRSRRRPNSRPRC